MWKGRLKVFVYRQCCRRGLTIVLWTYMEIFPMFICTPNWSHRVGTVDWNCTCTTTHVTMSLWWAIPGERQTQSIIYRMIEDSYRPIVCSFQLRMGFFFKAFVFFFFSIFYNSAVRKQAESDFLVPFYEYNNSNKSTIAPNFHRTKATSWTCACQLDRSYLLYKQFSIVGLDFISWMLQVSWWYFSDICYST